MSYEAEARVIHSHTYSIVQQFRRFFDNGVSMRDNEWVYPYSAVGKAGSRLVRHQLRYLVRNRHWLWIPKLAADAAAKFLGFHLGKRYRKLPEKLCVRFSMHRGIWAKLSSERWTALRMARRDRDKQPRKQPGLFFCQRCLRRV